VGELAARIGLSRPAATALVDRLVRQGMLERVPDESDRRRVIVRRAEAGRGITAPEVEALVHELDEFTRAFTSEECDAIARYLSGVVEIVERHVG
jgi:DNA-binding MarR family transcriptional regulator